MLLLHISDIHFKQGEAGDPDDPNLGLRDDMIQDVLFMRAKIGRPADAILISGDIAYAGKVKEYDFAYDWLDSQLCPAAECSIEDVFVIPGNHDVDLKAETDPASLFARSSLRSMAADKVDDQLRKWLRPEICRHNLRSNRKL